MNTRTPDYSQENVKLLELVQELEDDVLLNCGHIEYIYGHIKSIYGPQSTSTDTTEGKGNAKGL